MNSVICHFVSGDAFFSGFVAIAAGSVLLAINQAGLSRAAVVLVLCGWILVIASATALSWFGYGLAGVSSCGVLLGRFFQSRSRSDDSTSPASQEAASWRRPKVTAVCGWCSGMVAIGVMLFEIGLYHPSQIVVPNDLPVFVIGDSLSAGINDGVDIPWPERLGEMSSLTVINRAKAGATSRSAISQVEGLPEQCLVLVEIGGNDLLSGRSAGDFRNDVDELLTAIVSSGRDVDVAMFELPLPPFFHGYGAAQRDLAARHHVDLIPRRLLASVLFRDDATLDSIHLSNLGHQRLARRVSDFLGFNHPNHNDGDR